MYLEPSPVGELMSIDAFKLVFSLVSLSELRRDFEEPPARLLAPPDEESSSFIFGFCKLFEPSSLEDEEDVDDVDVVEELEGTGLVAKRRFCIGVVDLDDLEAPFIMKSLLNCFCEGLVGFVCG